MHLISRSEELILLTILKLKDQAYGVQIREQIYRDTGGRWSYASIYRPLDRLTRHQYVKKTKGEPMAVRGGKSKYYYAVTPLGKEALLAVREAQRNAWTDIPDVTLKTE